MNDEIQIQWLEKMSVRLRHKIYKMKPLTWQNFKIWAMTGYFGKGKVYEEAIQILKEKEKQDEIVDFRNKPIEFLALHVEIQKRLSIAKIDTVAEMLLIPSSHLFAMLEHEKKWFSVVKERIEGLGLQLKGDE